MERYEAAQNGIAEINDKLLTEFDEKLWLATVDSVIVHSKSEMAVTFKDDSEVTVEI